MHVLIIGAAGMMGRKLVSRLVTDGVIGGSVKNLGRYAASWIAGWPNRPSSTAALT